MSIFSSKLQCTKDILKNMVSNHPCFLHHKYVTNPVNVRVGLFHSEHKNTYKKGQENCVYNAI